LYISLQATVLKSSFKDLIFNFADFVGVILSQVNERVVDTQPRKISSKKEEEKFERMRRESGGVCCCDALHTTGLAIGQLGRKIWVIASHQKQNRDRGHVIMIIPPLPPPTPETFASRHRI
jgi:hypothetical protein